jgi:hypothetical protein
VAIEFTVSFREAHANEVIAVSRGHDCTKPIQESCSRVVREAILGGKSVGVQLQ